MSVLTKVFVVLLTVFSIAFAMATISFVARENNWMRVAKNYQNWALSAGAETKVVTAQMALTHEQDLMKISQLNTQLANKEAQLATQTSKVDELTNKNTQFDSQLASLTGTLKGVQQTLGVTQTQLVSEQDFARKLATRNTELERRNIDLNDRTKELTTSLAMATAQNRAYVEQIEAMQQQGGRRVQAPEIGMNVQKGVPAAAAAQGPTVAPIRGAITEVRGNLASINVGQADGVSRGMSFMVYRQGREGAAPEYVATIEISRVDANAAAGQIVRRNGDLRTGDLVRDDASFAQR